MNLFNPDLTQFPPRSPRVRLGGYVILPRCLDKCRATLGGKNGDYHYACPLDQHFLTFAGIDPEKLKAEVAQGKGDGELLEWIQANGAHKRSAAEIIAWSTWQENAPTGNVDSREYFNGLHTQTAPKRTDIFNWFDLLDVDDFASYGGKP
jgi:hypothetical protein